MKFKQAGLSLILILAFSILTLAGDLYLFMAGLPTISELIWSINQRSLAVAFGVGAVCGHLFTVPK
ncbi:hypothetical protein UFOVP178_27 [uncultured Caudovirales phage]|uniref:Uncharacterized protein n=1 Tax=uncultured Caudovirales phage TaxID=2100421 RepID=A0A6J7WC65_9CAUD|nr:hypothetical protein UFOVP178_27 [uncultured Caudovirales phage]